MKRRALLLLVALLLGAVLAPDARAQYVTQGITSL